MEDTVAMVTLADEIGFDVAWFAEHHFSNYSICPSPLMMASYCAGLTQRIRLGTAVLVLPLYDPVRLVQEIGLLDVQSGGRTVVGIGSGYQKYEFDRYHRKLSERTEIALELWDIIDMAFKNGAIEYRGKYFDIPPRRLPCGGCRNRCPNSMSPDLSQKCSRGSPRAVTRRSLPQAGGGSRRCATCTSISTRNSLRQACPPVHGRSACSNMSM